MFRPIANHQFHRKLLRHRKNPAPTQALGSARASPAAPLFNNTGMTRIFLPGRRRPAVRWHRLKLAGVRPIAVAKRKRLQRKYCAPAPTADGDQKRPPKLGGRFPLTFSYPICRLGPRASENSRPYLPGEIIPDDFHLSRCYSRSTRKSELLSFYCYLLICLLLQLSVVRNRRPQSLQFHERLYPDPGRLRAVRQDHRAVLGRHRQQQRQAVQDQRLAHVRGRGPRAARVRPPAADLVLRRRRRHVGFKPLAVLGGVFGYGLKRNVLDIYKYACRNYKPGDDIYAFGFSRGAFTIRLVVALIAVRAWCSRPTKASSTGRPTTRSGRSAGTGCRAACSGRPGCAAGSATR